MSPSTRPAHRRALPSAIATAALIAGLAACTAAPPEAVPSGATPSAGAPSTSAATATPSSSASPAQLTIDITITGNQVTPNAKKLDVARGTTVVLNVRSDHDDEIHAHTAGDGYELEVTAGQPATGSFVASDSGSFEIESHHLEKVIAILQVR